MINCFNISAAFMDVFGLSFYGGIAVLCVLVMRLFMRGIPKKYSYALWLVPAVRLMTFFSILSIINILQSGINSMTYSVIDNNSHLYTDTGAEAVRLAVDITAAAIPLTPQPTGISVAEQAIYILSRIWLVGLAIMLFFAALSYFKMLRRIKNARQKTDNVYVCNDIAAPFVMGIIKPKIYIPPDLTKAEEECILMHEKIHIKRFDYIFKVFYYIILSVHWFNPLVHIAFHKMERDMEMSCDEAVIAAVGDDARKPYSYALLRFSAGKQLSAPLSFGEKGVRRRIKNVLSFKIAGKVSSVCFCMFIAAFSVAVLLPPVEGMSADLAADSISNVINEHNAATAEYFGSGGAPSGAEDTIYFDVDTNCVVIKKTNYVESFKDIAVYDNYRDNQYVFSVSGNTAVTDIDVGGDTISRAATRNSGANAELVLYTKLPVSYSEMTEDNGYFYFKIIKASEKFDKLVVIAPAHGGEDTGVKAKNMLNVGISGSYHLEADTESYMAELLAEQVERIGSANGIKVYLTRNENEYVTLENTVKFADNVDGLFINLHYDEAKDGGTTAYYGNDNVGSKRLAQLLQANVTAAIGTADKGVHKDIFYTIKNTSCPAVMLEVCAIGSTDEEIMQKDGYMEKAAEAIIKSILEY